MNLGDNKVKVLLVCACLAVLCLVGYEQVRRNEFVGWDDDDYITENTRVNTGLTVRNVVWAFGKNNISYWHPLAWLSHMLDCELFGTRPAGHHLVSLFLHIVNALLLFIVLNRTTGATWKSAFVAALFVLHPINVDSVAWAAERKNVLSTFFLMLTILAYVYYCEKPNFHRYVAVFLLTAAGLLAKPTVAVLPFILLLLDYWPLQRLQLSSLSGPEAGRLSLYRAVIEKVPLFMISAAVVFTSSFILRSRQVTIPVRFVPVTLRLANALVSYASYIANMLWPRNLAVHYPYPKYVPFWHVAAAALLLVCITILAVCLARKKKFFIVGWLWFVGTLVPVSGLIQAGLWPAMADRFAYVPLIGLFIILAWAVPDLLQKHKYKTQALIVASTAVLLILLVLTRRQVYFWKDSYTLFSHTLKVTENNAPMHNNLANTLKDRNDIDAAIHHYRQALSIDPLYPKAHYNLAFILQLRGRTDEAISHYRQVLKIRPNNTDARNNLGMALMSKGKIDEAVEQYTLALKIDPDDTDLHYNLGIALQRLKRFDEAVIQFQQTLKIRPDFPGAENRLNRLLEQRAPLDSKTPADANKHPGPSSN